MDAVPSFAPLAARLAARADEIRPADGAEVGWANFMALFWYAIYQMLIALCEALDARAAAVAASASQAAEVRPDMAARPGRPTLTVVERAPRLAAAPFVEALPPRRDTVRSGIAGPEFSGPWRVLGAPPWPGLGGWRPTVPIASRNAASIISPKHANFVALS